MGSFPLLHLHCVTGAAMFIELLGARGLLSVVAIYPSAGGAELYYLIKTLNQRHTSLNQKKLDVESKRESVISLGLATLWIGSGV